MKINLQDEQRSCPSTFTVLAAKKSNLQRQYQTAVIHLAVTQLRIKTQTCHDVQTGIMSQALGSPQLNEDVYMSGHNIELTKKLT